MSPLIEYCLGNVSGRSVERLQRSESRTRPAMCLDHCGECCSSAFLVIDGVLYEGVSHESLLDEAERNCG